MDDEIEYEKVIQEDEVKGEQIRLVVSRFKERYYISLRRYFKDFYGEYLPSKEGISIEATISSTTNLAVGIREILSESEGSELILKELNKCL